MSMIIKVKLTDLEEKILDLLSRKPMGMTAEQISAYLEGAGIPLSSWQLSRVLRDMTHIGLVTGEHAGHVLRYRSKEPTSEENDIGKVMEE